jgi:predicted metal-dependent peptidase
MAKKSAYDELTNLSSGWEDEALEEKLEEIQENVYDIELHLENAQYVLQKLYDDFQDHTLANIHDMLKESINQIDVARGKLY